MTHQSLPFDTIRRDFLRRNKEEVQTRDDAYDYQISLNEPTCPPTISAAQQQKQHAADNNGQMWWRSGGGPAAAQFEESGEGGSAKIKHITETWDEYAVRTENKDRVLQQYFSEQRAAADAAEIRSQARAANSRASVKALTERENARKAATLRPVGHTLFVDFEEREAKVMLRQRAQIESNEVELRETTVIPAERSERKQIEIDAAKSLTEVLALLERQRAEKKAEEERILAERQAKEDAARAAEEKRRQDAEAAERLRREQEEEAKKAERKKREDERKAKAKAEREVRQKQRAAATDTTTAAASP